MVSSQCQIIPRCWSSKPLYCGSKEDQSSYVSFWKYKWMSGWVLFDVFDNTANTLTLLCGDTPPSIFIWFLTLWNTTFFFFLKIYDYERSTLTSFYLDRISWTSASLCSSALCSCVSGSVAVGLFEDTCSHMTPAWLKLMWCCKSFGTAVCMFVYACESQWNVSD